MSASGGLVSGAASGRPIEVRLQPGEWVFAAAVLADSPPDLLRRLNEEDP